MTRCTFCPRQATDTLHEVYAVCDSCRIAFLEGFSTGRIYESRRKRINPRKVKRGLQ